MAFHSKHSHALAAILMAIIFLVSGMGKLVSVEETQQYMEAYGVPGELLWPAAAFEIASGLALISGLLTSLHAVCLAGWCLLTAVIFHANFKDQEQKINFMKNLVMAGGFLILAETVRETHITEHTDIESVTPIEKRPLLARFKPVV